MSTRTFLFPSEAVMVLRHCFVLSFCLIGLMFSNSTLGQESESQSYRRVLKFPDAEPTKLFKLRGELSQDENVQIRVLDDKGSIVVTSRSLDALDRVEETLVRGLSRKSKPAMQEQQSSGSLMSGLLGNSLGGSIDGDQLGALLGGSFDQEDNRYLSKHATGDSEQSLRVLQTIMQDRDGVLMDSGSANNSVIIYGSKSDHDLVETTLRTLDHGATATTNTTCYVSVSVVCSKAGFDGAAYRELKDSESVVLARLAESGIIKLENPKVVCGVATIVTAQDSDRTRNSNSHRSFQVEQGKFMDGFSIGVSGSVIREGEGFGFDIGSEVYKRTDKTVASANTRSSVTLDINEVRLLGTCKIDNTNCAVLIEVIGVDEKGVGEKKLIRKKAASGQKRIARNPLAQAVDDRLPGPIQVELIPELETLLLKGKKADVEDLIKQIQELIDEVKSNKPEAMQIPVEGDAVEIARVLQELYDGQLAELYGPATVTPVQRNKAILIVGSESATELIKQILKQYEPHGPSIADLDNDSDSAQNSAERAEETQRQQRAMMQQMMRAMQQRAGGRQSGGGRR